MSNCIRSAFGTFVSRSLTGALMVAAGSPALSQVPSPCRLIANDVERLACHDHESGRLPVAQPVPTGATAAPVAKSDAAEFVRRVRLGSGITERWELDQQHQVGLLLPRPYKPMYVLPAVYTTHVNSAPSSPNPANTVSDPSQLDAVEAKFQISLKAKVATGLLGETGDIWLAYTQSSRWQVYNAQLSRPFRETNYEPEAMFVIRTDYTILGFTGRMAALSLNHQSNGRALPLSRSWNRVIGQVSLDNGDWELTLRPWWRLHEPSATDDNADIEGHVGRGEVLITRRLDNHVLSLQLRHSLRSGNDSRGSAQLDWAFPLPGSVKGYAQLFTGYGESLIDYNLRQTRIGVGVSLVEWQ